jgi:DNA repair protein RecO (recombination protein O)
MKRYKTQAVVLHTIKYGDTSMVAYLLTEAHGRRSYMVQGVKSSRGKGNRAALLQPMFLIEFEGIATPHSAMDRMTEVRMPVPLHGLPFDVRKSTIALFMAEVLYRLIKEVEPNSTLFDFVKNSVLALDTMEDGVANFHLWFLVQMSAFLGFYPSGEWSEGGFFDVVDGSFRREMPTHRLALDPDNARLLHTMMSCAPTQLNSIPLVRNRRAEFLSNLLNYFGYHLDSAPRIESLRILGEVF